MEDFISTEGDNARIFLTNMGLKVTLVYISKGEHCIVELSVVHLWTQKLVGNGCGKRKESSDGKGNSWADR